MNLYVHLINLITVGLKNMSKKSPFEVKPPDTPRFTFIF